MTRKSVSLRQEKRVKQIQRYSKKRKDLLEERRAAWLRGDLQSVQRCQVKLESLPRDSAAVRSRNRCPITGRSRGVWSKFGICRQKIREFFGAGYLPGTRKSSW